MRPLPLLLCLFAALARPAWADDESPEVLSIPETLLVCPGSDEIAARHRGLAAGKVLEVVPGEEGGTVRVRSGSSIVIERAVDSSTLAAIRALYAPEPPPLAGFDAAPPGADRERFLAGPPPGVAPADVQGVRDALGRAGPAADGYVRAILSLDPGLERRAAWWLLARLSGVGFHRLAGKADAPAAELAIDLGAISPEAFFENVRLACRARERFPWCRDLPEEEFLLHVLPHRGSGEPFQRWRRRFHDALSGAASSFESPEEVALFVNRLAAAIFRYRGDTGWEDQGALTLLATHEGRCEDMVNLVIAMLRAVGLPASHVYTPAWAKGDGNHAWCGVALPDEFLSFMGCEPRAEPPFFRSYMDEIVAAKVYFRSPFASIDVTDRFGRACELSLDVGRERAGREVHLDVLNSGGWRTVASARADGAGKVAFGAVGCREAILLLVSEEPAGFETAEVRAAGDPFVLLPDGTLRPLAGRGEPVAASLAPGPLAADREYALAAWIDSRWAEAGRFRTDSGGGAALALVPDRVYQALEGGRPAARPFVLESGSIVFY